MYISTVANNAFWWSSTVWWCTGTPSHTRVRADDEPDTRPTIGADSEGSTLRLTTTKRRPSRALLPKASRASASPAPPISKHVFPGHGRGFPATELAPSLEEGRGWGRWDENKWVGLQEGELMWMARFGAEIAKHNAPMISRSQNIADCEWAICVH